MESKPQGALKVYRPRKPKESPLWQCISTHFDTFLAVYEARYQPRYGFLRPTCRAVALAKAGYPGGCT